MKLVVTGGGTGGHVYPALEVARAAREAGWEVVYLGSERGQEGKLCRDQGFEFYAFPSEPLYSWRTIKGLKAAAHIWRATGLAKQALRSIKPDAVFSTGGYSSAPVVSAARSIHIPYVIHEQNTVPGRTNRILSRGAFAVATTFRKGGEHFAGTRVERTGLPIRKELRASAQGKLFATQTPANKKLILVMGGSQGALVLNESALAAAVRMVDEPVHWLIVAGVKHYEGMRETMRKMSVVAEIDMRAYLNAEEMAQALFAADVVVCRSGGSLAEVAAFRKPSVLVPYPHAMGDHQLHNAKEFEAMGAAMVVAQPDLTASDLQGRIMHWITDSGAVERAQQALMAWDIPDTNDRVLKLLKEAAQR